MTRFVRAGVVAAVLSAVAWFGGCSDSPGGPVCCDPLPQGLIVSDPVTVPGLAQAAASVSAPSGSAGDDVAYVSLPPGTVPDGRIATIRRVGDAATLTTAVLDGGFDPVPVEAEAGDSIEALVTDADGITIATIGVAVRAARPPIVVRTDPPRRKTGVPLNSVMVFVFSEPVAAGTLTSSSVRLFRGTTPIPGTVSLLQGTATAAVFEPTAQLAANTEYRLVVTRTVKDLSGDALAEEGTAEFTTGTSVLGDVARVSVQPGGDSGVVVPIGSGFQMTAIPRDAQGNVLPGRPVVWSSTNPSVANVTTTGLVTGLAVGEESIRADVEGVIGQARVSVKAALALLASVTVTPEAARVNVGAITYFSAVVRDTGGWITSRRAVTWSSGDPTVATVIPLGSDYAQVSGVANGVARIVATVQGQTDTAFVTVGPPPPSVGLTLSPDTATLLLRAPVLLRGLSMDGSGALTPIDGSELAWASSDPNVASVDANGLVTGTGDGSATITGTWSGYSATARVTVVRLEFTTLSAGFVHTCGLTPNGTAYCWGGNDFGTVGQPGDGDGDVFSDPQGIQARSPVAVAGGLTFASVSAGGLHTCGLTAAGVAYCWGYNGSGQLGNGTRTNSWRPVVVSGGLNFVAVEAGGYHTCGLTAGGVAYCWGSNGDLQLGNGTSTDNATPLLVSGGLTFAAIDPGGFHTCALAPGGVAYCWGYNVLGQLGDGTTTSRATPVAVVGGLTFAGLSTLVHHTCGHSSTGVGYCWGLNNHGHLGNGTTTNSSQPVAVSGGLTFAALTAGGLHSCGLASGQVAYCWGQNLTGAVGTGTAGSQIFATPQPVVGGLAFASVTAGDQHTCGITTEGVAYCWGSYRNGALGLIPTADGTPEKVLGQR